ncbi:MAG: hypothetical protein IT364_01385 [Candidatus Hydrogenedentes bacterium]|nr:hypothetical protein [Candidatus Hydrogenedentota bacterium]
MRKLGQTILIALLAAGTPAFAEAPFPAALDRAAVPLGTLGEPINDAVILGNGDLNALVFAEGNDLVIRVTKNDVWDARLDSPLNPPMPTLARLLELGPQPEWTNREYILPAGSTWSGKDAYHAHAYPCPRACGVLRVRGAAVPPLVARLDLRRACLDVHTSAGAYRIFIAADGNVIVVQRLDSPAGQPAHVQCAVEPVQSDDIPAPETGGNPVATWVAQQIPGDLDWPGMRFALALSQDGPNACASVVTSFESSAVAESAADLARGAVTSGLSDRWKDHMAVWETFWSRSGIAIQDEVLERVWYRNLYFLRCVSKPGVISTGLFAGMLDDKPAWHGDYHTNYNLQQTYWSAYAANQCEITEPYDRLMTGYLPRARWLAKTVFDLSGAYIPHVLFAFEAPDPATAKMPGGRQYIHHVWGFTQGVNGFSVQPLWWHYKYHPDRAFLEQVAYPAVRDVADFQADFVARCERSGDRVVLAPSVSPEHWGWTANFERNKDCAFDIAMFRYIFQAAIEGARTLGVDAGKEARWQEADRLLPDYPTSADDAQLVVDVKDAPPTRYNIPVPTTPVFPCDVITFASPEAERAKFAHTLSVLEHNGNNAPIMLAVARARLNTPDAYDWLRTELDRRERRNGTLSFNRLDPRYKFNDFGHYTEMFGAALPVTELVLQSVGDVIRVFPAWPGHLTAEFRTLRTQGGFLVSASMADGTVGEVRIESTAGGTLRFMSPWGKAEVKRGADGTWAAMAPTDSGVIQTDTAAQDVLFFRKASS